MFILIFLWYMFADIVFCFFYFYFLGSHSCSSDIISQKGFISHNFTFNVEFYSFVTDVDIEWYKGEKRISQNQTKYDICVQNRTIWFQNQYYYMNTASLFISNLESNDFGSYSIRISNIHGVCWRKLIIYDSGLYIWTSRQCPL
jgi:hypothetical protein